MKYEINEAEKEAILRASDLALKYAGRAFMAMSVLIENKMHNPLPTDTIVKEVKKDGKI